MRRLALLAAAAVAVAALGACKRQQETRFPAQPAASRPPEPMAWTRSTPDVIVELTLAPEIARHSGLRDRLYTDGVGELTGFMRTAAEDRQRLVAKGLPVRPYVRRIHWTLTADSPLLLSLREDWFDDTGGAHPNAGANGMLWSVGRDREVLPGELFPPSADHARLDAILCAAIDRTVAERRGGAPSPRSGSCPRWADADFVLERSGTPGRIGGVVFLFDPYTIGSFAEGEYQVHVPASAFIGAVAAPYAGAFLGGPADPPPARRG